MIRTLQQRYILDVLQKLGCARKEQLIDLFRPAMCASRPDKAEAVVNSTLFRLRCDCQQLREKDGVYYLTNAFPNDRMLEAIDVMIELAKAAPLDYRREKTPALLRFTVQERDVRRFMIAEYGAEPEDYVPGAHDRVILLFDGQGYAKPLPVSNKQFFAVKQSNGSHRYFASNGP